MSEPADERYIMAVDFDRVAALLLSRGEVLCAEWFPAGRRVGHEFKIGDIHGEPGDSLSINLTTGKWADFAGELKGGDLTSLYAAMRGIDQAEAARQLAPQYCNGAAATPIVRAPEQACEPIPDTDPPEHPDHGAPTATYRYGRAFIVCRYDTEAGKTFCPYTFRAGRWTRKAYPAPRPLYGLEQLTEKAHAPVLVTEGEKCADAARSALSAYACVTWAGGANAVKHNDWSVLADRDVVIWPDADLPGAKAAAQLAEILLPIARQVRIVNPAGQPEGWDIADAIADGWDDPVLTSWARKHVTGPVRPKQPATPAIEHEPVQPSALVTWQSLGLLCNSGGLAIPNESNVAMALSQHPATQRKIWYDTFRQEVWHSMEGVGKVWSDRETRRTLKWLQRGLQLAKFTKHHVHDGVLMYADEDERNSVHDFIESEPWDGVPRIEEWLSDFLGCPNDPHHRAAGRNWMLSMIARAYNPGCQMDHMLILEGEQRKGKSSVLRALAQPWYVTLSQRFGSKEFIEAIQGNWLIELADLQALAGARHSQILADITNRSDRYRAPWDKLASNHERRCVFAGSTEKHNDYLADTYGIGRFWSVRCDGDINIDALAAIRQQLFAEALVQWRAGEPYHLMPSQTREEQLSRVEVDPYVERVEEFLATRQETTGLEVFERVFIQRDELGRMIGRTIMDDRDSKRIAKIMRLLNWYVVPAKRGGKKRNLWQPVPVKATGTGTA